MNAVERIDRIERVVLEIALMVLQGTGMMHPDLKQVLKEIEAEIREREPID